MKSKIDNQVFLFKIITVGDSLVGKTSIIKRFVYNTFSEVMMMSVGMNASFKEQTLKNGKKIKLKLVDTAGQERFKSIPKKYYANADAVLFVFALDSQDSFDNISSWIQIFNEENTNDLNIPKYLIGNKSDLETNVNENDIQNFLDKNKDFIYKKTSAKEDNNKIKELFDELGEKLYALNKKYEGVEIKNIQLRDGKSLQKKNCSFTKCIV